MSRLYEIDQTLVSLMAGINQASGFAINVGSVTDDQLSLDNISKMAMPVVVVAMGDTIPEKHAHGRTKCRTEFALLCWAKSSTSEADTLELATAVWQRLFENQPDGSIRLPHLGLTYVTDLDVVGISPADTEEVVLSGLRLVVVSVVVTWTQERSNAQ